MSHNSIDKIQKVFRLESERGYDNRAVVGGLDKLLSSWEAEARADNLPDHWVKAVASGLATYSRQDPEGRAKTLADLWRLLQLSRDHPRLIPYTERQKEPRPQNNTLPIADRSRGNQNFGKNRSNPLPEKQNVPLNPTRLASDHPRALPYGNQPEKQQASVGLNAPLTVLPGIGPHYAESLSGLGLNTLGDLLYYFPRRYDDFSQLRPINRLVYGEDTTVIATIQNVSVRPTRGGQTQLVEVVVSDGTGSLRLTWFNQPWLAKKMIVGTPVSISGRVEQFLGRPIMNSPDVETLDQEQLNTNRIVPVYPLTARITQHWLRGVMRKTVSYWAPRMADYLPDSIRRSANLIDLQTALYQTHLPDSTDKLRAARERLAFDEIFFLQLGVLRQKRSWLSEAAQKFEVTQEWLEQQIASLPYQLTGAQQHAIDDIRHDLVSGRPMNRLLQGDVGSGKTIVAALATAMVTQTGAQTALMAPTSILAEQHYRSLTRLFGQDDEINTESSGWLQAGQIRLLVGDTPDAEKADIYQGLADGSIRLVIGTHALIESPVTFKALQLVIVDEQHRFGVAQRAMLRSKGNIPHLLVMTATPIPRSLSLTVYGDLDLTVMDEMPAGRQVVETHVLHPRERERAYNLIHSQVDKGNQVFIIYPYVERGENDEIRAAVEEHARLQKDIFPNYRLGLLHGRMKPELKDETMARFRDKDFDILVSTSVVEVGVDIPNATLMLIEGANRFGLAQLHQFRGRVGRGTAKSFCLLIPDTDEAVENERLAVMVQTNDGFVLAERDLEQRGPGEFLGTRQSGFTSLKMAILTDVRLIEKARVQAQTVFNSDPEFTAPENQLMLEILHRFWGEGQGDIS